MMETQEALGLIDENIKYIAVTFFFGIFWGAMISNMHFYRLFKIWPKGADKGSGCCKLKKQSFRLMYGVLILNIFPLFIFMLLINDFFGYVQIIPETTKTYIVFICSGVASLSVFSFSFMLPGLLQIKFHKCLYPQSSVNKRPRFRIARKHNESLYPISLKNKESGLWTWKKIAKDSNIAEDRGWANLVVAVLYFIIPLLLSCLIGRLCA